ncbi:uncharacterized protein AMSG_09674 [Thecamonas trahens ATCC 50062]|uniref:FH2 domain-containing protein n=1 Tax=Thecamonas trahens ATCC 50062 TaxID=461836 RepID=A0A0L0DNX9_THETB|nr:hypothetical protein AMSG_09674 [Thecamonas trahens ATCC 50062]KNC54017.1 hypothetical protein AMSG_09674 [Thecamonas trahens ATCC 50062]|eukprot:XP_013754032.1 hypothetical protein AMSG_09674 [Thecamonas trahens ATCC 50062]
MADSLTTTPSSSTSLEPKLEPELEPKLELDSSSPVALTTALNAFRSANAKSKLSSAVAKMMSQAVSDKNQRIIELNQRVKDLTLMLESREKQLDSMVTLRLKQKRQLDLSDLKRVVSAKSSAAHAAAARLSPWRRITAKRVLAWARGLPPLAAASADGFSSRRLLSLASLAADPLAAVSYIDADVPAHSAGEAFLFLLTLCRFLKSASSSWLEAFIHAAGVEAINAYVAFLDNSVSSAPPSLVRLGVHLLAMLARARLLATREAVTAFAAPSAAHSLQLLVVAAVAPGSSNPRGQAQLLDFVARVAEAATHVPDAILAALALAARHSAAPSASHLPVKHAPLSLLVALLDTCDEPYLRAAALRLLNTLLSATSTIEDRIELRSALEREGLNELLDLVHLETKAHLDQKSTDSALSNSAHRALLAELATFHASHAADSSDLATIASAHEVDLSSPASLFRAIDARLASSPAADAFLHIMQHLFIISSDNALASVAWPFVQRLLHRAVVLDSAEHTDAAPPRANLAAEALSLEEIDAILAKKRSAPALPPLKPLFWTKIPSDKLDTTVWKDTLTPEQLSDTLPTIAHLPLDESALVKLFAKTATSSDANSSARRPRHKSSKIRLLQVKRANNIAITLKQFDASFASANDIAAAIANTDVSSFTPHQLSALLKYAPHDDELALVREYLDHEPELDSIDALGAPERFFAAILDIDCYSERVAGMLLRLEFDSMVADLRDRLDALTRGVTQARSSSTLRSLLVLVRRIGNRLNAGSRRGNAAAFKLDILSKLRDTRATSRHNFSVLHYLATLVRASAPTLLAWHLHRFCVSVDAAAADCDRWDALAARRAARAARHHS